MQKYKLSFKQSFLRSSINEIECLAALIIIVVICFLQSCAVKKMSLEEARKVSISMKDEAFVPPPRNINDILDTLNQQGKFSESITAGIKAKADAIPPDTKNPAVLADFFHERGINARELGRYQQQLKDLRKAFEYSKKARVLDKNLQMKILLNTGSAEAIAGNFQRAILLYRQSMKENPLTTISHYLLAWMYFEIGDFKTAEKITQEGLSIIPGLLYEARLSQGPRAVRWQTSLMIERNRLKANSLDYRGFYSEAEGYRRSFLKMMRESYYIKKYPYVYLWQRIRLAKNLANQGRLIEAEFEIREALKEALGHGGKNSGATGEIISALGYVLLLQGRFEEAEKVLQAGIRILKISGLPDDCQFMGDAKLILGKVSVARFDFNGAAAQFNALQKSMQNNRYYYEKHIERNPEVLITMIKTNRVDEAMPIIQSNYRNYLENLGHENYWTIEMLAIRGMASALSENYQQALDDFSKALPLLLKVNAAETNTLKRQKLWIFTEAYLSLLRDIYAGKNKKPINADISAISFKLIEEFKSSRVQKAIGASGARSAVVDNELKDLVREEQDALTQINALETTLSSALAASPEQLNPDAIRDLKANIDRLKLARVSLFDEIRRCFPKYANFVHPEPVSIAKVQEHLNSSESLINIYPANEYTFVWAIPGTGDASFAILNIGRRELLENVANLRQSLNPNPEIFGDIPDFDLERAYDFYKKILEPVEKGWNDSKDLLIGVSGPLELIPFSVLVTEPIKVSSKPNLLFGEYQKVPWLIRQFSITRIPSATAFVTLRSIPESNTERNAFIGFGDPIFNLNQLERAQEKAGSEPIITVALKKKMHVRGIRLTEKGHLDKEQISSCNIGMLNRLPDTREEVLSIADAVGANPATDVFFGKQANEHRVKTMDLGNRRIIIFATHALIPGDLDGLHQPAIALSAPTVTGDDDDGLLSLDEILRLKLNADWVVLSACNTGAADGEGSEAISGLGRAFFYAGTKAILVSMWPVETTSAKRLTTGLFKYQKENPKLSRTQALQKSILSLIDSQGIRDEVSGEIIASYAHPLFWAPFIIVGEGGGVQK